MFDFFQAIGDFFWFIFGGLTFLGNLPNLLFSVIISILFVYWMLQIKKAGNN